MILDIRRRLLISGSEYLQPVPTHEFGSFSIESVVIRLQRKPPDVYQEECLKKSTISLTLY